MEQTCVPKRCLTNSSNTPPIESLLITTKRTSPVPQLYWISLPPPLSAETHQQPNDQGSSISRGMTSMLRTANPRKDHSQYTRDTRMQSNPKTRLEYTTTFQDIRLKTSTRSHNAKQPLYTSYTLTLLSPPASLLISECLDESNSTLHT